VITLTEPIQAHGREITEIEFRKPTGADVKACGYPFSMTLTEEGNMTMHPQAGAISGLIARLANIPPSSVGQMNFIDWNSCMGEIFSFFGQSIPSELSSGASTSRGSGNGHPP
jgi:hypothetical protein